MRAPAGLAAFYRETLGVEAEAGTLTVGASRIRLTDDDGGAFHHLAFLVPGDRFEAAHEWARSTVELLPGEDGETVFDFAFWDARACYFHDPAGNILELISHRDVGESGRAGPFAAGELLGLSEVGLVGDTAAMARVLREALGLEVWSGTVETPGRLAFVGERARTLILCPPGRPWLPTGRPAESHPLDVVVAGVVGEAVLDGGLHAVRGA